MEENRGEGHAGTGNILLVPPVWCRMGLRLGWKERKCFHLFFSLLFRGKIQPCKERWATSLRAGMLQALNRDRESFQAFPSSHQRGRLSHEGLHEGRLSQKGLHGERCEAMLVPGQWGQDGRAARQPAAQRAAAKHPDVLTRCLVRLLRR